MSYGIYKTTYRGNLKEAPRHSCTEDHYLTYYNIDRIAKEQKEYGEQITVLYDLSGSYVI